MTEAGVFLAVLIGYPLVYGARAGCRTYRQQDRQGSLVLFARVQQLGDAVAGGGGNQY